MQELFEVLLRFIGEILLEILLKGPGYLILKLFRPGLVSDNDSSFDGPDGCLLVLVGIAFWSLIIGIVWFFAG